MHWKALANELGSIVSLGRTIMSIKQQKVTLFQLLNESDLLFV